MLLGCNPSDLLPDDYDGDPLRDLHRVKKWAPRDSNPEPAVLVFPQVSAVAA